jgi:RNA polymerase sigma-70 factor (ECF subfamily)
MCDFAELLERVKAGDPQALSKLREQYSDALLRAARNLIGSALRPHCDATDLVQSVELVLWQGLRKGTFRVGNREQLFALAKVILRRQVARRWRSLKPMARTMEGRLGGTVADRPLFAAEGTAGRCAEFEDWKQHILNGLSDVDRRLVELRFLGHSTADAARIMGVEPEFLRVRLGRLRQRLREQLSNAGDPVKA